MKRFSVAIVGASGYTGAELVRVASSHPSIEIAALAADRNAGIEMSTVFPGFRHLDLPVLKHISEIDFSTIDIVFCALPHGASQQVVLELPTSSKIVDLSADFRLRDPMQYEKWYGKPHAAVELQKEAVYGLTEFYREQIRSARLVACTGCNSAAGLYALLPLVEAGIIDSDHIIIDLKTGVSGAGRSAKVGMLHAEVSEGCHAYGVANHRHLAEFDQELSLVAKKDVRVSFTPHLLPQNRGILATVYVKGDPQSIFTQLYERYEDEPFIIVLPYGEHPSTRHVRGANYVHIGVAADRNVGRAIVFSALDNLAKGSSGQAIQNSNLMLGIPETEGLTFSPLAP